tara:strand:- start:2864 stop:3853 length:990 start_codon:yes stop_codon:yes gene_type:complete
VKTFNFTLLAITIALSASASVQAATKAKDEKSMLNEQAGEYRSTSSDAQNVVTKELLEEVGRGVALRDTYRDEEEINNIHRTSIEAETDRVKAEMALSRERFILENVPPEIQIAGSKEVSAYVQKYFVENAASKKGDGGELSVIWGSTDSTLSQPVKNDEWKPVIQNVSTQTQDPVPQKTTDTKAAAEEEKVGLSDDEIKALEELGMSLDDIQAMAGNSPVKVESESKPKEKIAPLPKPQDSMTANVVIDKIQVERSIIMGNLSEVDVSLSMQVIRGDERRKVNKRFLSIKPGYMFEVDGARFEMSALNRQQVVFENLDTGVSARGLIH